MKRQHLYFLSMVAALLVSACTKEDKDGSNNQSTIEQPEDNSEKVTGEFWSTLTGSMDFPGMYSESASAYFMRSVQENILVLADTVYINHLGTIEDAADNYHHLSPADVNTFFSMKDSCIWEVVDTTHPEIPSFRYNFRVPYPSILGKIPDTVTRATGFNMDIKV